MKRKKEFSKRFLSIFLLSAALTLSVLFLIYRVQVKSRMTYMETRDAGIVSTIESAIYHDMNAAMSDLKVLREINEVEQFLDDPMPGIKAAIAKEFLAFSEGRRFYDQIRLLDEKGMEVVRVNFNNGASSIVPDEQLQDKSGRYYFKETFRLSKGDIYLSPFDLNVENGQVEKPLKPVMRIGTPLFDSQGRKRGVIILNYLGSEIINDIKELSSHISGHAMLVNPEGYWLIGQRPEDEWGFMFRERQDRKIENRLPEAWKQMAASDSGQFYDANGLFIFKTIHPVKAFSDLKDYYWKLIINVPPNMLSSVRKDLDREFLALSVFFMILQGVGGWYLANSWTRKKEAEDALQKAHDELEAGVHERTEELEVTTEELRSTNEELEKEIVERIDAESQFSRFNRLYLVLSKINEAVVRIRDREKLFKEACRIVVEDGNFLMSWIGTVDPSTLLVKPVAHCCGDYEGSYIDGLVVSVKDIPEGRGPIGNVIRGGGHVICNDIENDPAMAPWRDKALRYGYRSSAAFPLCMGTDVIGAVTIYSGDPHFFNNEEIELLDTMAADISFAIESIEAETQAKLAKERLLQSNTLLKTISRAQSEFILDINTPVLFEGLLKDLLALTGSEYGFIGEMFYDTDGNPYLKTHALTNIAWNDETRALYEKYAPAFEFRNLKSLFGEVMTTGKTVISNNPATDPRRCGLPAGHPPLNAFLGLPFYSGNNIIGMVGIANRQNGYDDEMVEYLQPFLSTCSNIITAYRVKKEAKLADIERVRAQQRYEGLVNNLPVGIYRNTPGERGRFIEANQALVAMLEAGSKEELFSHNVSDFYEDNNKRKEVSDKILKNGLIENEEIEIVTLKGNRIWVSFSAVMKKDDEGNIYFDGVVENITEHKKLESQLLHSQKMDAVGQLAGGIAHDFNNALTAILGFAQFLLMKKGDDEVIKNCTQHIVDAGESAASLVQGILAFSRKQTIIPQPIDITELVRNIEKILLRLIGEDMELKTALSDSSMIVKADPTQIEQVLMNLATNARDAMPGGGVITIGLEHVNLDDGFVKAHGYGESGNYALLSFADTGMGIDEETRKKIFEPFFTTKEVGKGTGLGLAMVYGIVKQHEGFINVYSEPGTGTTFRIYLPLVDLVAEPRKSSKIILPPRGTETVLLVEDDEMVRAITLTVLEDFGYKVIVAVNGEDAVSNFKENNDKIHLCITDMVMPKMGGREAYEAMRRIRPDLRVIFMSGYVADKTKGIIDEGLDFISKPVSPTDFLRKVREVLDR